MNINIRGYLLTHELFANGLFKVYKAEHSILTDQSLRITLLNHELMELPELKSEFSSSSFKLSFADHQCIIKNTDMLEENGNFAILSENIPLTPFSDFLGNKPFDEIKPIIENIFEAIIYLNDKKIYHSALSPENLFIDNYSNPRIANYGLAEIFLKAVNPDIRNSILENFNFYAPEVSERQVVLNDKTEVYSCGKLLEFICEIINVDESSKSIYYIISKSTNVDPAKRYRNVNELLNDFRNPGKFNYDNATQGHVKPEMPDLNVIIPKTNNKTESSNEPIISKNEPSEAKNVFTILDEIKNQKTNSQEPRQNFQATQQNNTTQQKQYSPPIPPPNQYSSNNSSKVNFQSKQNVSGNVTNPNQTVKPFSVLAIGIIAIVMSLIVPIFGIFLALVGFVKSSSNNKKVKDLKISLKQSDKQAQSIGTIFCVIALIISIIKIINFIVSIFS
ncbi:MAG TPA: protein kinase [Bacteroidales bacterium]|nr:protein kinase [Bacteroidales bacterium]